MTYRFTVPGIVRAESKKQRPLKLPDGRVVNMGPRTDDKPQVNYKAQVALFAKQAIPEPLTGPVALELHATRPRPASYPKRPTAQNWTKWADMAKRRDLDNVAKLVCDALTGAAYVDDKQIVDLHVTRGFGGNELAVTVREVTPDEVGLALAGRERVA